MRLPAKPRTTNINAQSQADRHEKLALHEVLSISSITEVLRVPGGWIYRGFDSKDSEDRTAVFVPLSDEFKEI